MMPLTNVQQEKLATVYRALPKLSRLINLLAQGEYEDPVTGDTVVLTDAQFANGVNLLKTKMNQLIPLVQSL